MLVSVIVPIYGVEAYIARCARSLLSQTWQEAEFIFVNDGTRDRSMEVLAEVLAEYPQRRIEIIHQANAGLPQARRSGIARAQGEYILNVDSDDWLEPDALEQAMKTALASDADLVHFSFWKEYGHRRKLDRERPYTEADKPVWLPRLYRDRAYGYIWNKLARRSLYDGIFFPRYNMHEDIVFCTQVIWKARRIAALDKALLHYRRDNPQASSRDSNARRRLQSARNMLDLYEFYRDSLPGSPVEPVLNDIILRGAWAAYRYDKGLFEQRPYLREAAARLPLIPGHRVLLAQQILLKCWLHL